MTILLSWLLDLAFGEPPARLHPVIWMGRYLQAVRKSSRPAIIHGMLAWLGGAVVVVVVAFIVQWLIALLSESVSPWLAVVAMAILLKPLFAWRALLEAARAVLHAPDLPAARRMLSRHLVSRDTSNLSAGEVYGATIESVAENLSDSLIAPLFYFVIGGLPLAALYRYANTADALWGYRTSELERFGKFAARADDALNLIPSRLSALVLCLACPLAGLNIWQACHLWRRDARLTPSPNAGQPMSAASGALGVQLGKRGVYMLGAEFREPTQADVHRALRLITLAAWFAIGLFIAISTLLQRLITVC
jgi:adenosylcobinamide-phosphate synthase